MAKQTAANCLVMFSTVINYRPSRSYNKSNADTSCRASADIPRRLNPRRKAQVLINMQRPDLAFLGKSKRK
jgi:hypothetical protein